MNIISLNTPICKETIAELKPGDVCHISGTIFTGRDAVMPKLVAALKKEPEGVLANVIRGSAIFHTAVSPAGIGPTSSNKLEIEENIPALSKAGVRLHIGKGRLKEETLASLGEEGSVFAVVPPVTALLENCILEKKIEAFPDLGMEAMHYLKVKDFPVIIAAANGNSIYKAEE